MKHEKQYPNAYSLFMPLKLNMKYNYKLLEWFLGNWTETLQFHKEKHKLPLPSMNVQMTPVQMTLVQMTLVQMTLVQMTLVQIRSKFAYNEAQVSLKAH